MKDKIIKVINESIEIKQNFLKNSTQISLLEEVVKRIIEAYKNNKKLLCCGNGGSAADAQHMVAELVGRFKKERKPLNAIALTTNTSIITALANDYSYDLVFSKQVEAYGEKGDIFVGISTSGNAESVIKAAQKAKEIGLLTVGLTGQNGGRLKNYVDYCICVPSDYTPRIQELHITVIHIICELVEEWVFQNL